MKERESQSHLDSSGADAPVELGSVEEERVSLAEPVQVRNWASRLGISPERLRELVAQVGPRLCDLQQRLNQPEVVD